MVAFSDSLILKDRLLVAIMAVSKIKSIRVLARKLGISHTTVSDALRDNPRVSAKTREMVKRGAKEFGYEYNPLAGSIMSEIRRSSVGSFRGVAAVVDLESDQDRSTGAATYHSLLLRGATEAAGRLGFKVDHFVLGEEHISLPRLNSILASRGIRAVLFLPIKGSPATKELDWDQLTGIYTDYLITDPAIHTVCPDHFRSMTIALRKLIEMGYQRPGLILSEAHDRRLLFSWEAAFASYWSHTDHELTVPLLSNDLNREEFIAWFQSTKPDVVLTHRPEVFHWMKEIGCKIPETHGFCCLNIVMTPLDAAGLDLQPKFGGSRAMELLISQLQRNEYGIPEVPSTTTYAAKWKDGPTLRPQS